MSGYGLIALGLLGASLATSASSMYCTSCTEFRTSLSSEQEKKYMSISKQRFRNYLVGMLIGIVLATIYYYMCCKESMNNTHVFVMLSIILGSQYFYYTLAPKSYMMPELTNDDQRAKWLAVYKTMKTRYHIGFVIGIIACLAFCHALKK